MGELALSLYWIYTVFKFFLGLSKHKLKPPLTELSTVSEALSSTKYIPHLPAGSKWTEGFESMCVLFYLVKGGNL